MDSKDAFKDYPSLRPRPVKYSIHMYYLNFLKIFLSSTTAELFVLSLGIPNPKVQLYDATRATTTGGESAVTTNIWNPVRGILRGEGIRSVYGGISFMLMRHLLFNAPRVHFYDKIRQRITQPDPTEFKFLPSLLAGVAAGGTAKVLVKPLENIQQRMQMDARRGLPIRAMRSINHIYERYGVQGLWKGIGPGALHAMLLTAGKANEEGPNANITNNYPTISSALLYSYQVTPPVTISASNNSCSGLAQTIADLSTSWHHSCPV